MPGARELSIHVSDEIGAVDAIQLRPRGALALYVMAHGAGAGMRHAFMEDMAEALAAHGIATLRYQFAYMQRGRGGPDRPPKLTAVVRAAVKQARKSRLPLLAGGKSMGGRMTSLAHSEQPLAGVQGLVFLGFPLHRPGVPATERAQHLRAIELPMLFLQGERDKLADLRKLRGVHRRLGRLAKLHLIPQGDHSFAVPKRTGLSREDVIEQLAATTRAWAEKILDRAWK